MKEKRKRSTKLLLAKPTLLTRLIFLSKINTVKYEPCKHGSSPPQYGTAVLFICNSFDSN